MYKEVLALNILQWLIRHKNPTQIYILNLQQFDYQPHCCIADVSRNIMTNFKEQAHFFRKIYLSYFI